MPSLLIENNVHLDIRGFVSYASRFVFLTIGVGDSIAEDIHARIRERRSGFRRLPIQDKIGRLAVGRLTRMFPYGVSRHCRLFYIGAVFG